MRGREGEEEKNRRDGKREEERKNIGRIGEGEEKIWERGRGE